MAAIELPDPYDDALYAGAAEFASQKGDRAACLVTRIGIFPTVLSMGIERFSIALYEDLSARENLRVTRERYREGVVPSSELLDAEIALQRAGLNRAETLAHLQLALAGLRRAVGGPE